MNQMTVYFRLKDNETMFIFHQKKKMKLCL